MSALRVATRDHNPPAIGPSNIRGMIDNVKISAVWAALGGGRLWGNRGRAFWRGGDGLSVGLDDAKGLFYDHVAGAGGGILDLIRLVRGCSRSEAVEWLCDLTGTPHPKLDQNWKRRAAFHAVEASEFTRWRIMTERSLRCDLVAHLHLYHAAKKWLIDHEDEIETDRWAFMMRCQNEAWERFQRTEAEVTQFRKSTPEELRPWFRAEVTIKIDPAYLAAHGLLKRDVWDLRREQLAGRAKCDFIPDDDAMGRMVATAVEFKEQQRAIRKAAERGNA